MLSLFGFFEDGVDGSSKELGVYLEHGRLEQGGSGDDILGHVHCLELDVYQAFCDDFDVGIQPPVKVDSVPELECFVVELVVN